MKLTSGQVHAVSAEEQRFCTEILSDPGIADTLKAEQAREKLRRTVPNIWSLNPQPIDWVLRDIVARKAVTMLAGSGGAGKTWFGLQLSKTHCHGGKMLGRDMTQPGDTLYLDRENSFSLMRERLDLIEFSQTQRFFFWGLHCAVPPPSLEKVGVYIEIVRSFPHPPLLIFDSLIRFHAAGDENSSAEMAPIMGSLRNIAEAGAAILVLHHLGKATDNGYRGSSELLAGCDISLSLIEKDGSIQLRTHKNRLGPPVSLALVFDVEDGNGFSVTDDPLAKKRDEELQAITDLIRRTPGLHKTEIEIQLSGRVSRNRIRELLKDGPWVTRTGANGAQLHYPPGWILQDR